MKIKSLILFLIVKNIIRFKTFINVFIYKNFLELLVASTQSLILIITAYFITYLKQLLRYSLLN